MKAATTMREISVGWSHAFTGGRRVVRPGSSVCSAAAGRARSSSAAGPVEIVMGQPFDGNRGSGVHPTCNTSICSYLGTGKASHLADGSSEGKTGVTAHDIRRDHHAYRHRRSDWQHR